MTAKRWTFVFLALSVVLITVMLFREAFSGPTFRAEDHASYTECIAAIPPEWRPGSLERSGAETSCAYIHTPPPHR